MDNNYSYSELGLSRGKVNSGIFRIIPFWDAVRTISPHSWPIRVQRMSPEKNFGVKGKIKKTTEFQKLLFVKKKKKNK